MENYKLPKVNFSQPISGQDTSAKCLLNIPLICRQETELLSTECSSQDPDSYRDSSF
ncbi:MAG: hypothetical protein ABJN36_09520 [Cyclobacteriaceae bacterium]